MATLTTHVLDQRSGVPAAGMTIALLDADSGETLSQTRTNADGRLDTPLLNEAAGGRYRLIFYVGGYFRDDGVESPFLDRVPVEVTLTGGVRYHVPLLVTPWAYSVYRGS